MVEPLTSEEIEALEAGRSPFSQQLLVRRLLATIREKDHDVQILRQLLTSASPPALPPGAS